MALNNLAGRIIISTLAQIMLVIQKSGRTGPGTGCKVVDRCLFHYLGPVLCLSGGDRRSSEPENQYGLAPAMSETKAVFE